MDVHTDVDMVALNDGVKRKASVDNIDVDMDVNMEMDELEEEMQEDIKPFPNLEPVDIPVSMDVKVELPTLDDVRIDDVDNLAPQEEQHEVDPVFEEKEPSPPPVRRSSRRSRSTTRIAQVKDELESSDEEPLSSKPQSRGTRNDDKSRPTPRHISRISSAATPSLAEAEDFDISMLDSGPSSQFQSPPPRPPVVEGKIFSGLVFWVDLGMKNRGDLLKEIKVSRHFYSQMIQLTGRLLVGRSLPIMRMLRMS